MITEIDKWLDDYTGSMYREQPLAQDWARVNKIGEELGEVIAELILWTGQNPRKSISSIAKERMLYELADVVATATLAIQHFTKDEKETTAIISANWMKIYERIS
jgi:hypothetical protein